MDKKYHIEITTEALKPHFSVEALNTIIYANIQQDKLIFLLGCDHYHFDGNSFEMGFRYISEQQDLVIKYVNKGHFILAREALGRMIHSWQDFYSHSNYIDLWLNKSGDMKPTEVVFNDVDILTSSKLASGKNYGLIEIIGFIPGIANILKPLMPKDSHACMNLDSPRSGDRFIYAYFAGLKRTRLIFDQLKQKLEERSVRQHIINKFTDKNILK